MKRFVWMAAAAVAFSSPAAAADLTADTVYEDVILPMATAYKWTGVYFGINGGGAWGDLDWRYKSGGNKANQSTEGGLIGGTLGYNIQAGENWLWGIEGDFDWAGIDGSTKCPNPIYRCRSELRSFGTLRARTGWVSDRVLLFGTGGLAFGNQHLDTKQPGASVPPSGKPTNGSSTTAVGWTAGLGAEYAFSRKWTGKLEWLYYDLATEIYKVDFKLKVKGSQSGNIVRVGLNYRFN